MDVPGRDGGRSNGRERGESLEDVVISRNTWDICTL